MTRRQMIGVLLSLAGGIGLLILAAHFFRGGDLTMALLTGVAGIALLVLARQDFAKLRRP